MDRRLTAEDREFQARMREIFRTKVPQEVRDKVAHGHELDRADFVSAQKTLHAEGIAVPGWPVEYGDQDLSPLQRHIWATEMQAACVPAPLGFNTNMVGR